MKMKQISDSTLKITISLNDLEERGMELADFLMPQEKTEDFFHSVLEELDLPDHFRMSGMLSFRVTPKQDRVDIFVTKSEMATDFSMTDMFDMDEMRQLPAEELIEQMGRLFEEKGDKPALKRLEEAEQAEEAQELEEEQETMDYVHYVLTFEQLTDVVAFSKTVNYPVEASELYKYQDGYQLTVLLHVAGKDRVYPSQVYARILEHAKESRYTRAHLREHAILLREGDILSELAGLRG